jgi:hypothetical protein
MRSKIRHWTMELWLCRNRVFIREEQLFGFPRLLESNLSFFSIFCN